MVNPILPRTVGDLIMILESLPQDLPILVSGYESGIEPSPQNYDPFCHKYYGSDRHSGPNEHLTPVSEAILRSLWITED